MINKDDNVLCVLFGLGVVMHLFAQQHVVLYFGWLRPKSILFIHTIKLWLGLSKWEKIKQEVLMDWCSEVYLAHSQWHKRHSRRFSSCLQGQVQLWLSLRRFVVLRQRWRNKHIRTHIHTHPHWLWCGFWRGGAEFCLLNRVDGWVTGEMNGEQKVAPSLLYLFSMHTLLSKIFVMQILPKNPSYASWEVHCVCVWV